MRGKTKLKEQMGGQGLSLQLYWWCIIVVYYTSDSTKNLSLKLQSLLCTGPAKATLLMEIGIGVRIDVEILYAKNSTIETS